jgi:hypothetical protein
VLFVIGSCVPVVGGSRATAGHALLYD